MKPRVLGRIDAEDLARLRLWDARIDTARLMPGAYGRAEIEEAFIRYYQIYGEIAERYGLPEDVAWAVRLSNGAVVEEGD